LGAERRGLRRDPRRATAGTSRALPRIQRAQQAREALWVERLVPREGSPLSEPGEARGEAARDEAARDEAARDDKARAKAPPFDADPRSSSLRRALYFDQTSRLPEQLLERNDRAAAAAGIELRMPFLDHALAEYVSALPDDRRVRGMATKWILREGVQAAHSRWSRGAKGRLRMPLRDWLRNELRDTLLEHLQSGASLTRPHYAAAALDRMLKEHLEGKDNHEIPLWTLLNLEICTASTSRRRQQAALAHQPPALHDAARDRPPRGARAASRAERAGRAARAPTPAPELSGALARTFSPWIASPCGCRRRPTSRQRSASATAGSTSLRAQRRARRAPPALEPRSEDRNRGAAPVRQDARLPRQRPRRRHQVPVGAPTGTCIS